MPYLISQNNTDQQTKYKLLLGSNRIGRSKDNDIVLSDPSISRYHAVIEISDSSFTITKISKTNPILINNINIDIHELHHLDYIRIGNLSFQFLKHLYSDEKTTIHPEISQSKNKIFKEYFIEPNEFNINELRSQKVRGTVLRLHQVDKNQGNINKLKILLQVSKKLSSPEELDIVLHKILELISEIIYFDRAAILLLDEKNKKLEKKAVKSRGRITTEGNFYSNKIVDWVYENGKIMATADARTDERFQDSQSILGQKIGASLCIPLKPKENVIGVLYIDNLDIWGMYSDQDIEFVGALANQAAIAIDNSLLYTKVRENERRMSQFLEAIPIGISVHKSDGEIEYANQKARNLLGINTLIGKHTQDLTIWHNIYRAGTDQLYPREELPITLSLQGETVRSDDLEMYHSENLISLELSSTPIIDSKGEIESAIAAFQDITQRKKAEKVLSDYNKTLESQVEQRTQELRFALNQLQETQKQLVESEKMAALGSLVAGIAHEINTPIGVGLMASSTLNDHTQEILAAYQNGKIKRSQLQKFLEIATTSTKMILDNLQRAGELIQSFKQVAVDQTSEVKRQFKVKEYIEEILTTLSPKIKSTKHQIQVLGDENLELVSYPGRISQIITNLLMNSFSHAYEEEDEGFIVIKLESVNNEIIITYSDDGKGIPPENLEKIFEPFFTTNRGDGKTGNTGLGLNLVYNLVTQTLNGKINCESQLGIGSKFIISIPCGN